MRQKTECAYDALLLDLIYNHGSWELGLGLIACSIRNSHASVPDWTTGVELILGDLRTSCYKSERLQGGLQQLGDCWPLVQISDDGGFFEDSGQRDDVYMGVRSESQLAMEIILGRLVIGSALSDELEFKDLTEEYRHCPNCTHVHMESSTW